LDSRTGRRFLDVAELDDISSVLAMAVLFACLAALADASGARQHSGLEVAQSVGMLLLKLLVFGALCYLFARWGEPWITRATETLDPPPVRMLVVAGVGFLIAGIAAALGFSVAIGAFLAGLAFSRDPHSVRIEASFQSVYELFMPFFFIGIGRSIAPTTLLAGIQLGGMVLGAAVLGKLLGILPTATVMGGPRAAVLLGVSMIPRAEVALLVMHRGLQLGDWAVPQRVYAAMVLTSAVTCIAGPLLLQFLLARWPQSKAAD
jgi:Kef-type K+ transport system membrane component KefB